MTNKSKCQCGIAVENVCLTLAIIHAIATGLLMVASIIGTFIFIVLYVQERNIHTDYYADYIDTIDMPYDHKYEALVVAPQPEMSVLAGVNIGVLALVALISFVFSAMLCNGIYNRRPGQVKAFFIFGVIMLLLEGAISTMGLFQRDYVPAGLYGLLGFAIYSLFLVLVYSTYLKIVNSAMFKKQRLLES